MYFFMNINIKYVCLICRVIEAVSKVYGVERHFVTRHKGYVTCYAQESEMHGNKFDELKRNLGCIMQYHVILLMKSKLLTLLRAKSQTSWLRLNPLEMIMLLKEVELWQSLVN